LRAFGDIGYMTFDKSSFAEKYKGRRTNSNPVAESERALEILFNYSIISYLRPRPSGGTDWIWKYKQPDQNFDPNADRFKVHLGLQDFANLRAERRARKKEATS
ncbi:MAG: hypothetical protein VW891_15145, partial [Novosphingobium sp.]